MVTGSRNTRAAAASALTLLVAVALLSNACRREAPKAAEPAANQTAAAQPAGSAAAPADISKLSGDIARLEKQAERNPADEDTRAELARLFVRRGDAQRGAGQLREALADYQSALRLAPDNDEAAANAAAVDRQLGGDQQEDENGAPAPLPITPNVADEEGKPTPTPNKQ